MLLQYKMIDFNSLDKARKYALYKNSNVLFHFTVDSENNMRVLNGTMKGYIIEPVNQRIFAGPEYSIKDIGEAPTVATIKVDKVKGRPRTPE